MESGKTSEGVDPNIWIRPSGQRSDIAGIAPDSEPKMPKYKTLEAVTLRITSEDFEFLHDLEREIMKSRSRENRKERITKNSIVRAMIGCLRNVKFNRKDIPDENELRMRIMKGLKSHPPWMF